MASGGRQSPLKRNRPNSEISSNSNNAGDMPWMLLPNNLELSSKHRASKKQRNKDKIKSSSTAANSSTHPSGQNSNSNQLSSHSFPRTKLATWLRDQLGTGMPSKQNRSAASDESSSDIDQAVSNQRNINVPVNQKSQSSRFQDIPGTSRRNMKENENTTSCKEEYTKKQPDTSIIYERLNHLKDCISQVSNLLEQLEESNEPSAQEEKRDLEGMMKILTDEQHHHNIFLHQLSAGNSDNAANGAPSSLLKKNSGSSKMSSSHRDVNGGISFSNVEDNTDRQNHLLEKVKASQEKLTALKQQQALLMSKQRDTEDKLAAFQAQFVKSSPEESLNDQDWEYLPPRLANPSNQSTGDNSVVNADTSWDNEPYSASQLQWAPSSPGKSGKTGQRNLLPAEWKEEPQDLGRLHVSLDHIKKRVEILQQLSDNRNVADPPDVTDLELDDVGERVAAVEWQRKKLTNKLVELKERKKANDELIKELTTLKQAATKTKDAVIYGSANSQNAQPGTSNDESARNLDDLRETLHQLKGLLNSKPLSNSQDAATGNDENDIASVNFNSGLPNDAASSQHGHRSAPLKRDNIRKEQNSGFPARRHYEAEGRANEDPDVPAVAAASPSPDQITWDSDHVQEKIREFENAKQKLQMMQELMSLIQEAKQSNRSIPPEYIELLTTLEKMEENFNEDETITDNEDDDDRSSIVEMKTNDGSAGATATAVLENQNNNTHTSQMRSAEHNRVNQAKENSSEIRNLAHLIQERERLLKLHEEFVELQKKFPTSSQQNNERIRSSGEGGNLQKKKSKTMYAAVTNENLHLRPVRQDNLLTRKNVATMESQNRDEPSSTLSSRENLSTKNDNINNLSAKLTKPSTSRSSADCTARCNSDFPTFNANINRSLRTDYLNREQSKQQNYARNQDNQRSNSSVNSEPLDGSSSALAPDTTAAATWGGSSTQENFEDENEEPIESLEDQEGEEDEGSNEGMNDRIPEDAVTISRILNAYSNKGSNSRNLPAQPSLNRRDNRLQKYFKSTHLNQWSLRKNLAKEQTSTPRIQPSTSTQSRNIEEVAAPDAQIEASRLPQGGAESNGGTGLSSFAQQLQQQLDQLNALCQPFLQDPSAAQTNRMPISVNDLMGHYTQQLQLQQHLLLSLSQCYHTLYVQQLEIQHLQRCLQQNTDSEGNVAAMNPLPPPGTSAEDFIFRPWYLAPWLNTAVTPISFPPGQISPMSAPPFLQPAQPGAFTFSPTTVPAAGPTPCALVTGVQPTRAVVHPAGQETRPGNETLNNQVPPRTRANNFWDNFRSYSRQNLLSTSNNNKAKESTTLAGSPQVRQVHPLVTNDNTRSHRSRVFIPPHTQSNTPAFQTADRLLARPVANVELQDLVTKSKKPNSSRQQSLNTTQVAPEVPQRTLSSLSVNNNAAPAKYSSEQTHDAENRPCFILRPSTSNCTSQRCETSAASKLCATSSASVSQQGGVYSEVSKVASQNDSQSGFMMELMQEIKNLGSDSLRQRALRAVREMAQSESTSDAASCITEREKSDDQENHKPQERYMQHFETNQDDNSTVINMPANSDISLGTNENSSQWNNQNWPAATIIPLGKFHFTKPSTGAIKKKPVGKVTHPCPSSVDYMPTTDLPNDKASHVSANGRSESERSLDNLIEKVILDVLPYLHNHIMDECCSTVRTNLSSKIIETLKDNSNVQFSPSFLQQLHKILNRLLAKYSGMKWCECEPDLWKSVAEVLLKELSVYNSVLLKQATEEHQQYINAASAQPDLLPPFGKSVSERKRQMVPSKDSKEEQVQVVVCTNNSLGSVLQETQDLIGELYINMPIDENSQLPINHNGLPPTDIARNAVSGANAFCSYFNNCSQTGTAEEDMSYEFGPEAEAEPEVEAGTEADLAEADQSPGQQGVTATVDTWHVDPSITASIGRSEADHIDENLCPEMEVADAAVAAATSDVVIAEQDIEDKSSIEITLDDIPTKLMPLSKEELQKRITEEQEANSLLSEVVDEVPLVGNADGSKDPTPYL